jgi:hypothetical protein
LLQSIDLEGCGDITDIGVSALDDGWSISVAVFASQTLENQHLVMDVVSYSALISSVVVMSQTSMYQH